MILVQKFLTGEGAAKRATFETRHSTTHLFRPVRYRDGEIDTQPFDAAAYKAKRYTWRLEKLRRKSPV